MCYKVYQVEGGGGYNKNKVKCCYRLAEGWMSLRDLCGFKNDTLCYAQVIGNPKLRLCISDRKNTHAHTLRLMRRMRSTSLQATFVCNRHPALKREEFIPHCSRCIRSVIMLGVFFLCSLATKICWRLQFSVMVGCHSNTLLDN